jgi:hypothetical protein
MAEETFTREGALEAWNKAAGKVDQYDVREVEAEDGTKQTQLIDKDTGSLSVAVNGDNPWKELTQKAGVWKIDDGVNPKEAMSNENKQFETSEGVLATPSQPEALQGVQEPVEVDNRTEAEKSGETQDSPSENVSKARAEQLGEDRTQSRTKREK